MPETTLQGYHDGGRRYTVRAILPGSEAYDNAIRVILGEDSPFSTASQMDRLVADVRSRHLSADLLRGAYAGRRLVSACLAIESPGAATVLTPQAPPGRIPPDATLSALQAVKSAAFARHIRLVQTLLSPEDEALPGVFRSAGFSFLTQLLYLEKPMSSDDRGRCSSEDVDWVPYTPQTEPLFLAALEASYIDSLDCPALTGLRSTSDVLAGHRSAGDSGSRYWWVAARKSQPYGVLLLAHQRRSGVVEVAYMGVAPPARGSGLADALLAKAVEETRLLDLDVLTVAVDRANSPARRVYNRWGFVPVGRRDAWIAASSGVRI